MTWREFDLRAWDEAGVRVVQVTGEFDIAGCERFRRRAERDDAEMIVVDLRGATFLDSCALRELIELHRLADLSGTRLAILRPGGQADLDLQADRDGRPPAALRREGAAPRSSSTTGNRAVAARICR